MAKTEKELTRLEKIYVKFQDIKKKSEQDTKFDKSTMADAFNVAPTICYWIAQKAEWQRVFRDLDLKRKNAYRKAYEFYQTDYPLKISTKDEYTLFIESDPNYVDIMNECQTVKEIIQYIDATVDAVKTKGYQVKMYIEWYKFTQGS